MTSLVILASSLTSISANVVNKSSPVDWQPFWSRYLCKVIAPTGVQTFSPRDLGHDILKDLILTASTKKLDKSSDPVHGIWQTTYQFDSYGETAEAPIEITWSYAKTHQLTVIKVTTSLESAVRQIHCSYKKPNTNNE